MTVPNSFDCSRRPWRKRRSTRLPLLLLCLFLLVSATCASSEHQHQHQQQTQHNDLQPPSDHSTPHAYIAYFKGENFGNNRNLISILINGHPVSDVLLHNSSMVSFRIPSSVYDDKQLFHSSHVEISVSSQPPTRIPLTILENIISKVQVEDWKKSITDNNNNNNNNINDEVPPTNTNNINNDEHLKISEMITLNENLINEANTHFKLNLPKSNVKALNLLLKANTNGNYTAMTMLASIYLSGKPGVPRDVKLAVEYLDKACDHGIPDAHALRAFLYATGYAAPYIPLNTAAALLHWKFAADGGSNLARMSLAFRYLSGLNVHESCDIAVSMYRDVADELYPDLLRDHEDMYIKMKRVPPLERLREQERREREEQHLKQQQQQQHEEAGEAEEDVDMEDSDEDDLEVDDNEDIILKEEGDGEEYEEIENDYVEEEEPQPGDQASQNDAHGQQEQNQPPLESPPPPLQGEQQQPEQGITEIKIHDGLKFQTSKDGTKIKSEPELKEPELKTADELFYTEQNISGDELDELTRIIIEPKGFVLPQSERKHLTEEGIQRIAGEKHDMVQYYRHNAERGDSQFQLIMGQLYYYGAADLPQDMEKARSWFKRASSKQDKHEAYAYLGFIDLKQGLNESAAANFQVAAEKNDRLGSLGLAYLHLRGIGTARNIALAGQLYYKSAQEKVPEAVFNLGVLMENGVAFRQSISEAYELFKKAAELGHMRARYKVALMTLDVQVRKGLGQKPCQQAVEQLKMVAEQGMWSTVLVRALRAYERGDYEDALYRYMLAAHAGLEVGQYNAAFLFEHGKVLNSPRLGLSYLQSLTARGNKYASYGQGRRWWMFLDDDDDDGKQSSDEEAGTKEEDEEEEGETKKEHAKQNSINLAKEERLVMVDQAMDLYQMSILQHSSEAMLRLGDLAYAEAKDYEKATNAYGRAGKANNAEALFNLGMMHARGYGMNADKHMAKRYFDLAVEASDEARIPAIIALTTIRYIDYAHEQWESIQNYWHDLRTLYFSTSEPDPIEQSSTIPARSISEQQEQGQFNDHGAQETPDKQRQQSFKASFSPDIAIVTALLAILVAVVNARHRRMLRANDPDPDLLPDAPRPDGGEQRPAQEDNGPDQRPVPEDGDDDGEQDANENEQPQRNDP